MNESEFACHVGAGLDPQSGYVTKGRVAHACTGAAAPLPGFLAARSTANPDWTGGLNDCLVCGKCALLHALPCHADAFSLVRGG
eukprot:15334222-Heterocapsa_arctica.AAC.1